MAVGDELLRPGPRGCSLRPAVRGVREPTFLPDWEVREALVQEDVTVSEGQGVPALDEAVRPGAAGASTAVVPVRPQLPVLVRAD